MSLSVVYHGNSENTPLKRQYIVPFLIKNLLNGYMYIWGHKGIDNFYTYDGYFGEIFAFIE